MEHRVKDHTKLLGLPSLEGHRLVLPAVRAGLLALGLLLPLNLPFALSRVDPEKTLGWWTASVSDPGAAGVVITRILWHAGTAGLAPGDVVLEVNGRPATAAQLERTRREARPGDTVQLRVLHDGNDRVVRVPVVRSSGSYAGYSWYRVVLVVAGWLMGMALVAWRGFRLPPVLLGAALMLIAPATFQVKLPGEGLLLGAANLCWQLEAAAYRFFFPALLFHFLALHSSEVGIFRSRALWSGTYLLLFAALALATDLFRDPLAWANPGPRQDFRATAGLVFEILALGGAFALRRRWSALPGPVRWLVFAILLVLVTGVPLSIAVITVGERNQVIEFLRQIKSLAMLLLVPTSALYFLASPQLDGTEWNYRRQVSSWASALLNGLYAFAVAGAAAIFLSTTGRSLGGTEWLLFASIFLAAIAFSPVLRWAREMVDRRMFGHWAELEARAHTFVDHICAELEPARIGHRVRRELPPLLDTTSAALVFARELTHEWGLDLASEAHELATEPRAALLEQVGRRTLQNGAILVPIYRPGGDLVGALRIGTRIDGREFEAPEYAVLRTLAQGLSAALRNAETYLQLRRVQFELDETERIASIGALAAGLAHEIKNPLAGLKMGLHLLERNRLDPYKLTRMQQDLNRIDDLVSGLLGFAHEGADEDPQHVDLCELTRACVARARLVAEDRHVALVERYPDTSATTLGRIPQLRLVISNLLTNALDAAGENGVVEVSLALLPSLVELTVRDTGPGIPPELAARIFDLSFSTKPGGAGLGLALARREVERLGGRIELDSGNGAGTLLRVTLRRADLTA